MNGPPRRCPVCARSLDGRRPQTVTCSPACRRERHRRARLALGLADGPYTSAAQYEARRKRAKHPRGA